MKSGTRLVPAFHSHWPCRSLYRCSSSSSSSSAPYSYSFFSPRRKRKKDGESFLIGCLLISPSSPLSPLRHFTSTVCSTSTGSGHFEGPHDEDIPRVHFAKLPIFDRQRTVLVLVSTDPSPNYSHFIVGNSSLRTSPHPPRTSSSSDDSYSPSPPRLSHSLSSGIYFTLRRVMVHGLLRVSFFSFSSRSFHQSPPPWTPRRSYFVCGFVRVFFSSHSPLVIRSLYEKKKSHHSKSSRFLPK